MKTSKIIPVILIVGFIVVDWFFFHDAMKAGETPTFAEHLTGLLSLLVFWLSYQLLRRRK